MNPTEQIKSLLTNRRRLSIFLVWLFHLSAIIGISVGYADWFMPKTPLNLLVVFVLLLLGFEERRLRFWLALVIFFVGGMLLEWVGVHYGFLFGNYAYGDNLGPKLDGIPYFIGINWALLTLVTGLMATALFPKSGSSDQEIPEASARHNTFIPTIKRILIGASLMVFLDVFLEFAAPIFDFWAFEGGLAPLQNYVAWFGFAVIFHTIYQSLNLKGDFIFAWHLYVVQLLFFAYFYVYYYAI